MWGWVCVFIRQGKRVRSVRVLATIKASLIDAIKMSDEMSDGGADKAALRWR